jgi:hypothetical protein
LKHYNCTIFIPKALQAALATGGTFQGEYARSGTGEMTLAGFLDKSSERKSFMTKWFF